MQDDVWKHKLTPEQYRVLREKGTDAPFTGLFYKFDQDGVYRCAGCGNVLFDSTMKFDSDCGWPSFDRVVRSDAVEFIDDTSAGMHRVEVVCKQCKGHLGHVFDDGPTQTGARFCINSTSLDFNKRDV